MAWNDGPQPVLTTGRLILRPFDVADGPRIDVLAGDRAIADKTARIPHPYPAGGGAAWVATHRELWSSGDAMTCAIVLAGGGEVAGAISLELAASRDVAVLGYWLGVPYWNQGYMTEAARALIDFGFGVMGLNRIEATYLMRNPASGRVMEKAGLAHEGVARQAMRKWGVYEDVGMRAIVRSDWEALKA